MIFFYHLDIYGYKIWKTGSSAVDRLLLCWVSLPLSLSLSLSLFLQYCSLGRGKTTVLSWEQEKGKQSRELKKTFYLAKQGNNTLKFSYPAKYSFFDPASPPPKNIEIQNFEPPKMVRAYVYQSTPPPTHTHTHPGQQVAYTDWKLVWVSLRLSLSTYQIYTP